MDEEIVPPPREASPDEHLDDDPEQFFIPGGWDQTPTDALKEPGGAIPDLPVWDQPDAAYRQSPQPATAKEPLRLAPRERDESTAPFASTLTLRATVSLGECAKLCDQLAHEWRANALVPTFEDVVLRAAARAFGEVWGTNAPVGLRRIDGGSELLALAPATTGNSFRQFVAEFADTPREETEADFVVTSFLATGVEQADPRLATGFFALTIGAERMVVVLERNVPSHGREITLSLAYSSESVSDGVAAALLSRIRELVEAPYALLAD